MYAVEDRSSERNELNKGPSRETLDLVIRISAVHQPFYKYNQMIVQTRVSVLPLISKYRQAG